MVLFYLNLFGRVDGCFLRKMVFDEGSIEGGKVKLRRSLKRLEAENLICSSSWINGLKIYGINNLKSNKSKLVDLGINFLGFRSFSASQMEHDLYVCRVFEMWMDQHKERTPFFLTERVVRKGHPFFKDSMPDLVFSGVEDFRTFFIAEIETTPKGVSRYEKKMIDYLELDGLQAAVFYCSSSLIKRRIERAVESIGIQNHKFKIKTIGDFNESK